MSYITLVGISGLVAIAACWALAVVLFRVGTTGSVARKLAVLLVVEGVVLITAGFPEFVLQIPESYYESHESLGFFLELLHHTADGFMVILYPTFLALALNTSLTRPFANTRVRIGIAIVTAAMVTAVTVSPQPITYMLFYSSVTVLFVYAFVASIHAWRTANRGLARERAGIFALAFGIRDVSWGLSYATAAWMMSHPELTGMPPIAWAAKAVYALGTLIAVPLIAYGILRSHLFDIDLKIRWTIKQSTLATVVVTFVFVLSEGADRLLSAELGSVGGLIAAAIVVFFLTPLQRFAENVASAAMPNTKNTPEYATFRKMQVYEEAVSEAHTEGGISEKERALLVRLRDSLGISESDAESIESELTNREPSFA